MPPPPGPPPARPRGFPVEQFIAQGIGFATFNKDDLAPDFVDSEGLGVKAVYLKAGHTEAGRYRMGGYWGLGMGREPGPRLPRDG